MLITALTVSLSLNPFLYVVLFVNVIVLISKYLFCTVRKLNSPIFIITWNFSDLNRIEYPSFAKITKLKYKLSELEKFAIKEYVALAISKFSPNYRPHFGTPQLDKWNLKFIC